MLKELKISLYDIFGYLLPGAVLLQAIVVFFWAVFLPEKQTSMFSGNVSEWVFVSLAAYFLGHLAQAITNVFEHLPWIEQLRLANPHSSEPSRESVELAKDAIGRVLGKKEAGRRLASACARMITQRGVEEEVIEIYEYREGFYRGLTVALFVLFTSLIVLAYRESHDTLTRSPVLVICILALVLAALTFTPLRKKLKLTTGWSIIAGISLFVGLIIAQRWVGAADRSVTIGPFQAVGPSLLRTIVWLAILSLISSRLAFLRYRMFEALGARAAVTGFLALKSNGKSSPA